MQLPFTRRLALAFALHLAVVATGIGGKPLLAQSRSAARLSQGQAAYQFLRAVLRADYATAYSRLAPEVRRGITLQRFMAAARPLWKSGQRRGQGIELYKLGVRLGDGGSSRLFYAFAFASDSAAKPPPAVLEVVFRDTAARAVLGFGLRPVLRPPPTPAKTSGQRR
ncbi:hypothetical protein I2I05_15125 [Hymenobacter sp. BT683]|uniref:DUF3887 domain-containing protein n=1 Tax=Hymenobacter jeongseonensis TaxID=2791027 RepID=A0ABS0IK58_9BACT|nr:hypothetical protein [Hymenobacter jeongseonensis]MBF9238736.1 hypothetical protein [Hymenobacter jeongseonensis]